VKVDEKEISTKELKNGGKITTVPYGMAVWSTGIGTRPFIKDFMAQIGQVCCREICSYTVQNSISFLFTKHALSLLNRLAGVL